MITRESAVSITAMLERALDDLRWCHSVVQVSPDESLASRFEPAWAATANTGGMLSAIYEVFPDLAGEDPTEGSTEQRLAATARRGEQFSTEKIRAALEDAVTQLESVASAIGGAVGVAQIDKERFTTRCFESATALRTALRLLA